MNPHDLRTRVAKTTRRRPRRWRPFAQARAFARSLGFRSIGQWQCWAASWDRPGDIPADPYVVYQAEWVDWHDWLGKHRAGRWRPFAEARAHVRSLDLGTLERWRAWAKSPDRPPDIPSAPRRSYRDEWAGWSDWLGR